MNKNRILVTGGTGFIGSHLLRRLFQTSRYYLITTSRNINTIPNCQNTINIQGITASTDWADALKDVDTVIHLAARAHVVNEGEIKPIEKYREINTQGTLALAKQAIEASVKRFIFFSSIGVNGNISLSPFIEEDPASPCSDYAQSKFEAEKSLFNLVKGTTMELVIIRPPLVYGADAPGNFNRLINGVNKSFPFPFRSINNKRSLISIDNLVDFIIICIEHPKAANQIFLVSDDDDVSTSQLIAKMAKSLGVPNLSIPIPSSWFQFFTKLINKPELAQRLCASLQVDISKAKELLDWKPPYSVDECMKKTADDFLLKSKKS